MANLSIIREKQFAARFGKVILEVDGVNQAAIYPGETKNIPLSSGRHTIKAKTSPIIRADAFSSREYNVAVDENGSVKLKLSSPYLAQGHVWILTIFRFVAAIFTFIVGKYIKDDFLIVYFMWFIVLWCIVEYFFDQKKLHLLLYAS